MKPVTFDPAMLHADGAGLAMVEEGAEIARLRLGGPGVAHVAMRPGEHLVGLGEQFVRMEQTGRRWRASISDLLGAEPRDTYNYVPFLLSSAGYAVIVESYAPCLWDLSGPDSWSVAVPEACELVVLRGSPLRMVELQAGLYGTAPLPPPWMLGVWKTTLSGTESVWREGDRLREAAVPVTALWIYDHYDEDTNSGCGLSGTYPRGEYDDLAALVRGVHDRGYKALGYVQPCMYFGSRPYREAEARGYLVRRDDGETAVIPYFNPCVPDGISPRRWGESGGAYVDLTNADAARWYQNLLTATADQGWDGWMQDMGEHLPDDTVLSDGTSGTQARNRYPLLYHRLAAEVRRDGFGEFVRSGALGTTRYVCAVWPGDQHCDWTAGRGLRSVLPAGPSAGLLGTGCWGPDIGGVVDGRDGGTAGQDEELWLRWCAYGALTPIMRDHLGFKFGAGTPVDLWSSTRTLDQFRRYAELHLSLFPYLYGLARDASQSGTPSVRALFLDAPDHEEAWSTEDQYLLGSDLLVAPVHTKGVTTREVWFPPGEWVSWWDDNARVEGPVKLEVDAPVERIPLFQRAGASVPLLAEPDPRLDAAVDQPTVERTVSP